MSHERLTDFNDLHRAAGIEAVRHQIGNALENFTTGTGRGELTSRRMRRTPATDRQGEAAHQARQGVQHRGFPQHQAAARESTCCRHGCPLRGWRWSTRLAVSAKRSLA